MCSYGKRKKISKVQEHSGTGTIAWRVSRGAEPQVWYYDGGVVRQPECNGCIERFNRTLEEEVFSLNHFKTLDEANEAIRKFVDNYNRQWLIYRLGYKSLLEYREEYERKVA